jgi:thioredoxin 1
MQVIQGTDKLEEFIWESSKEKNVIVLYFGADWCGPCKELKKKLEKQEAKDDMPNLKICYLDIDEDNNYDIVQTYKVKSLPTQIFIMLKGTQIVEIGRIIGLDWTKFNLNYAAIMEHLNDPSKELKIM